MSKLYWSEEGRVVATLCEELTHYRRARKVLQLAPTAAPGVLYVLARCYPEGGLPLRVAVNGTEVPAIQSTAAGAYRWYEIRVDPSLLSSGENRFEFWTDSTAMNAWSLAMEAGHPAPKSYVTDDGSGVWRNERMGYLNVVRGEYVVRMRLAEGEDAPPPAMAWEDPAHPRLESIRSMLPPKARDQGPPLERVRALSSWLASRWEHTGSCRTELYTPWDVETILAWGPARAGHNGKRPS